MGFRHLRRSRAPNGMDTTAENRTATFRAQDQVWPVRVIRKDGEIALERYGIGSGPERRWQSYSTAKSITSTLVGAALHNGAIGSLEDRCDLYLPRLRGSAYEGITVRNLMRMCSGVAWSEEDDGLSDVGRLQRALASRRPGCILDLLCDLPRAQPQGVVFN